ncbi:hypothetical protein OSTOST_18924 [Ostertagia ostertagi]
MSDQEFHSCVDFSRFANHHMIAVTADGVRLVPSDRVPSLPPTPYNIDSSFLGNGIDSSVASDRKNSSVSYRDLDNFDENSSSDKFGRSGGFQDKGQSGNREFRGRGRGGFRGRGERGFGRGRGRGGGNRDDDNGRENSYRGRGRGRGGDYRGDGNSSYRSRDSFGDNNSSGLESKPKREHSYSRSGSGSPCSPVSKKANFGLFLNTSASVRNNTRTRSYSRSRSGSPLSPAAKKTGNIRSDHVSRPCSYSRSRSSSPVAGKRNDVSREAAKSSDRERKCSNKSTRNSCSYSRSRSNSPINSAGKEPSTGSRQSSRSKPHSYSRSRSNSPATTKRKSTVNVSMNNRSDRSYSRSGSRSPPRAVPTNNTTGNLSTRSRSPSGGRSRSPSSNEVNNNNPEEPHENNTSRSIYNTEPDNYMNSGYGSGRQSVRVTLSIILYPVQLEMLKVPVIDRNRNTFNRSATQPDHNASGVFFLD